MPFFISKPKSQWKNLVKISWKLEITITLTLHSKVTTLCLSLPILNKSKFKNLHLFKEDCAWKPNISMQRTVPGWVFVIHIIVMPQASLIQSGRKMELVRWVYRMMSAWMTDVCAPATLCAFNFYYRTIASNSFLFMFNMLQFHLRFLPEKWRVKSEAML